MRAWPFRLFLCGTLCAPFLILGALYPSMPAEIPIIRGWIGHSAFFAPKSPFTVFRVPLMNLTHGLIFIILRWHRNDFEGKERREAYSKVFTTLAVTVALKSNFEALEFREHWLGW